MFGISNLSPAEVDRLTYRDAWVRYFLPALRHQRDADGGAETPEITEPGAQRAFIDAMCAGKTYDGENWWTPALAQIEAKQRAKGG